MSKNKKNKRPKSEDGSRGKFHECKKSLHERVVKSDKLYTRNTKHKKNNE